MKNKFLLSTILLSFVISFSGFSQKKKQPNVLFIAVDDLRADLGTYGSNVVISPNIDQLSSEGIQFNKAYVQQAICGPSRASLLTGSRPETINVIDLFQDFRANRPSIVTLPQHFKENGYETVYLGKVFHGQYSDDEMSWSRKPLKAKRNDNVPETSGGYALAESQLMYLKNKISLEAKYGEKLIRENWLDKGPALESADVPDETYDDGYNTLSAIETLNEMVKKDDKPWFLALGFKKPHLDWIAPKKYWDLYDEAKIPIATQVNPPKDGAAMALSESLELRVSADIPKTGEFSKELQRKLRHGYYACISYVDAQIGKMIQALKDSGEYENTIIVFWSDHGFNLGEMGYWGKATNYEIATRVPFIISAPGVTDKTKGQKADALVELIDIYPTLCDLAGLAKPSNLEGKSLVPILKKPSTKSKKPAFSLFPTPALREWAARPFTPPFRTTFFKPLIIKIEDKIKAQMGDKWDKETFEQFVMGYSMRTDDYRIVIWKDRRRPKNTPLFIELYDHRSDSNESVNIASQNPKLVKELIDQFNESY